MIEAISAKNLDEVLPLIRAYQSFYKVKEVDEQNNKLFFSQFGENSDKGCLFAYRKEGQLIAFAIVYFSYSSTITAKVAVMNDLFTIEASRGQGVAAALIKHCANYGQSKGAIRLQWVTAPDNKVAQSVYKALGAAQSSWEFFSYTG